MNDIVYYPVELHSHTDHSDGDFSVEELIQNAIGFGYKALALTDHNTMSGMQEISEKKLDSRLPVMKGIEWTTYFGHMLVYDSDEMIDWRQASIDNIDEYIEEIKEANGLVGIAHPYAVGSPICTGCHWRFHVKNWENVDYIEIWNSLNPEESFSNKLAYQHWNSLLEQGYHISCGSGRDWHRRDKKNSNTAITYIGFAGELTVKTMKEALKKGRMYATLGPRIEMELKIEGEIYNLGDIVPKGQGMLTLLVLDTEIPYLQSFGFLSRKIRLITKGNIISDYESTDEDLSVPVNLEPGYLRVEVLGVCKGRENERLIVTSPFYIQ